MNQLVQNLRTGETSLMEVPVPLVKKGYVLIKTRKTLVSAGTERMLVEFSKAGFIRKARLQPDKLRLFVGKIKTEGLFSATQSALRRLDQRLPLGYCNAGKVMEIGEGVAGFRVGDRVVSNGPHAEIVCVPANLVARIPANVSDEEAAFTVLGAVALHGIRLLGPEMGMRVAVFGLGPLGLMAVDLLKAAGCQVVAVEPDQVRRQIAAKKGVSVAGSLHTEVADYVLQKYGEIDGVLITASSESNAIISQAASVCRKRGKIVLVGSVGLRLNRANFYRKELTFQVACSYGPGRYDHMYEENGVDYPLPYVRWTENRNFQEVLRQLSVGSLDVKPLISRIIPLAEYDRIYHSEGHAVATLIDYNMECTANSMVQCVKSTAIPDKVVAAVLGAGNFARLTLLPALKGKFIKYIVSSGGLSATELALKYGVPFAATHYHDVLPDPALNLVLIATRHNDHAQMVIDATRAVKHVFVEKPLALTREELREIREEAGKGTTSLTVGFNRRFSPYIRVMRDLLGDSPAQVIVTVNAGALPADSWVLDRGRGGGRLIGEACHFIDLVSCLTGSPITEVCTNALLINNYLSTENVSILLKCENGSSGVVNYFSNGSRSYAKERVEVHSLGRTLVLDDFKILHGYGFHGFGRLAVGYQKGHREQFQALFEMVEEGGRPIMAFEGIVNTTQATFAAVESLETGSWVNVL
nr:bi-domain-containing oxidoreductase [uncultured Dyadobacter sp.]